MFRVLLIIVVFVVMAAVGKSYYRAKEAEKQAIAAAQIAKEEARVLADQLAKEKEETAANEQKVQLGTSLRSEEPAQISSTKQVDSDPVDPRAKELEGQAKAFIAKSLKDPDSVQFRNINVFYGVPVSKLRTNGAAGAKTDLVCGEYNAKNSYGGYVGFGWFLWDTDKQGALMNSLGKHDELGQMLEQLAYKHCSEFMAK